MSSKNKKYQYVTSNAIIGLILIEILFWGGLITTYFIISKNVVEFRIEHPDLLWLLLAIIPLNFVWIYHRLWRNKAIRKFAEKETLQILEKHSKKKRLKSLYIALLEQENLLLNY